MIALRAKDIPFEVTYIDLRDKPDWFLKLSPHGKVPVLNVDDETLYESSAIAEFLDETAPPRLHPEDPIKRARNRAWTDFVPTFAKALSSVYWAGTVEERDAALKDAPPILKRVEDAIERERGNDGPYFNGPELSLVDCAYAPFLQRFTVFDERAGTGLLDGYPRLCTWRDALLDNAVIQGSVVDNFPAYFAQAMVRHGSVSVSLFAAELEAAE